MSFLSKIEILAMSNLTSSDTGVEDAVVWVSSGEFGGKDCQHGARIKVVLGSKITSDGLDNAATVTLTDPPQVVGALPAKVKKKVLLFIKKNRSTLLNYWDGKISTREMINGIVKI